MHPLVAVLAVLGSLYGLVRFLQDQASPPAGPSTTAAERPRRPPIIGRTIKVRDTRHSQTLRIVGREGQVSHQAEDGFWVVRLSDPKPFSVKLRPEDMELSRPLAVIAPGTPTSGDNLQQLLSKLGIFDIDRHLSTMTPREIVDRLATLMEWPVTRPALLVLNLFLVESLDPVLDMISFLKRLYPHLFIVVWTKQPLKVRRLAIQAGADVAYAKYIEDDKMLAGIAQEMKRRLEGRNTPLS